MAVGNNSTKTMTYYNIANGKVFQKATAAQGAVTMPNPTSPDDRSKDKTGFFHDYVEGFVTRMWIQKTTFESKIITSLKIEMIDTDGQISKFDISYGSGYFFGFVKRLPNVNFTKEVRLSPVLLYDKDKNKWVYSIIINQPSGNGAFDKIQNAFLKDSERQLPPWEKSTDATGNVVWNKNAQYLAINDILSKEIFPQLPFSTDQLIYESGSYPTPPDYDEMKKKFVLNPFTDGPATDIPKEEGHVEITQHQRGRQEEPLEPIDDDLPF